MSALPPDAPAWAWPLHPFGKNSAFHCRDAIARRPFPVDGNIHLSSDVTFTSTARLHRGRSFGVLIHQANSNQARFGVGRLYYLPTAADVRTEPGRGLVGRVAGETVFLGSERWLAEQAPQAVRRKFFSLIDMLLLEKTPIPMRPCGRAWVAALCYRFYDFTIKLLSLRALIMTIMVAPAPETPDLQSTITRCPRTIPLRSQG